MNILLIESDPVIARSITKVGQELEHTVRVASDPQQAVVLSDEQKPDVVITEIALKKHSGFEFLYEFRSYYDWLKVPVVVYTAQRLDGQVTDSPAWRYVNVAALCYKPKVSVTQLFEQLNKLVAA
jgi:DNA-binding response OmpR family regulator